MRALLSCFGKFPPSPQLYAGLAFSPLPFRFNRKNDAAKFLSVLIFLSLSLASSFSFWSLAFAFLFNFEGKVTDVCLLFPKPSWNLCLRF